ncbi:MAG: hypothetical protein ACI9OJ_001995 [Myxococcota bacterium]|jgi:hypothetical protein
MTDQNPPEAFDIFRHYYLGFDDDYEYAMHNIGQTARHFGMEVPALKTRLAELELMPETVKRVDYNLASAHADAYALDLEGASIGERQTLSERIWVEFQQARSKGLADSMIDHLDIANFPGEAAKLGITIKDSNAE